MLTIFFKYIMHIPRRERLRVDHIRKKANEITIGVMWMDITIIGAGSVSVNEDIFHGRVISIKDGVVIVDGEEKGDFSVDGNKINVQVNGDVERIDAGDVDVTVSGSVGSVRTQSGDVKCNDIGGDAETMIGNITCRNISGNARTLSGNIRGVYLK